MAQINWQLEILNIQILIHLLLFISSSAKRKHCCKNESLTLSELFNKLFFHFVSPVTFKQDQTGLFISFLSPLPLSPLPSLSPSPLASTGVKCRRQNSLYLEQQNKVIVTSRATICYDQEKGKKMSQLFAEFFCSFCLFVKSKYKFILEVKFT